MIMKDLIELYKAALNKNADIKQIKSCISTFDSVVCNKLIRTDEAIGGSIAYASVRPTSYKQFWLQS